MPPVLCAIVTPLTTFVFLPVALGVSLFSLSPVGPSPLSGDTGDPQLALSRGRGRTFANPRPLAVGLCLDDLCPLADQHWRERGHPPQHHGLHVLWLRRVRPSPGRHVGVCRRKHVWRDCLLFVWRVSQLSLRRSVVAVSDPRWSCSFWLCFGLILSPWTGIAAGYTDHVEFEKAIG